MTRLAGLADFCGLCLVEITGKWSALQSLLPLRVDEGSHAIRGGVAERSEAG
jgi:hypothetical protein